MSGTIKRRQWGRTHRNAIVCAAACLLVSARAVAGPKVDTVLLRNGDRLTCEILKLEQARLSVSTDPLGTVTVHWAEVAGVTSPRDFEVTFESGERYYGVLSGSPAGGDLTVTGLAAPPVTRTLAEVTALVPIGRSLWGRINGNLDVGFSFAQANLETHWTLNGGVVYRSPKYRVSTSIASQLTAREDADRTSRNTVSLNGSRLFDSLWFATVLAQVQQNEELQLDLRTVGGGGFGKMLWQSNHRTIAAYTGVVYTREQFVDQPVSNTAEAALGGELDFFTPGKEDFSLSNSVISYFALTGRSRVRVEVQSAWRHEFLSDFYWSLNGLESFDSDPPDAQKKNDFSLSLSIGWKF
jgi:Protein of unknown function, DUF481